MCVWIICFVYFIYVWAVFYLGVPANVWVSIRNSFSIASFKKALMISFAFVVAIADIDLSEEYCTQWQVSNLQKKVSFQINEKKISFSSSNFRGRPIMN